jgi:hypothetical protein
MHRLPGTEQTLAERIKVIGRILRSEIHKLMNSIWKKEEFRDECKDPNILPVNRGVIKQIVVITVALRTKYYPSFRCQC